TTPTSAPRLLHQHHQLLPVYITDLALTDSSSLSLHAALPNCGLPPLKAGVPDPPSKGGYRTPPQKGGTGDQIGRSAPVPPRRDGGRADLRKEKGTPRGAGSLRSEEHTSELQSREKLVCRLLLEKKRTQVTR